MRKNKIRLKSFEEKHSDAINYDFERKKIIILKAKFNGAQKKPETLKAKTNCRCRSIEIIKSKSVTNIRISKFQFCEFF